MRCSWLVFAVLGCVFVSAEQSTNELTLMPVQTAFPMLPARHAKVENIFAFSSFITQKDSTDVPFAAQCFLILTSVFVLVNIVIYIAQQVTYYRQKYFSTQEIKGAHLISQAFDEVTLENAKAALTFTPVVALMIVFILFRAENNGVNMQDDQQWQTLEIGIGIVTAGILLQALDAFAMGFQSNVISGIAESLGTLMTYTGYLFLITGLFVVQSPIIPDSVAAQCFTALAVFLLLCSLAIKLVLLKNRLVASLSSKEHLAPLDAVFNAQKLEEIQSAAEFSPILMLLFFYLHFNFVKVGQPTPATESGAIGATVGMFLQAIAVIFKSQTYPTVSLIFRVAAVLVTYVCLAIAMYGTFQAGWPAPSFAIAAVLIILLLISFVKIVIIVLQEVSSRLAQAEDGEGGQSVSRLMKLFKDMETTTRHGSIVAILLLYIHFRASFLLKVEPQTFIEDIGYLTPMILLAMFSILAQIVFQLVELGIGSSVVITSLIAVTITCSNVAVGGITYAAVSS